jgi:hypothetical protein
MNLIDNLPKENYMNRIDLTKITIAIIVLVNAMPAQAERPRSTRTDGYISRPELTYCQQVFIRYANCKILAREIGLDEGGALDYCRPYKPSDLGCYEAR